MHAFQISLNVGLGRFSTLKSAFLIFTTIPLKLMENNTASNQLELLVKRLNEAERRSKLLFAEVKSIRREITELRQNIPNSGASNQDTVLIQAAFNKESRAPRRTILLENVPSTSTVNIVDGPTARDGQPQSSEPPSKKSKGSLPMENGYVQVYTDGACENNGKANAKAGIGVWFDDGHPLNISKPVDGRATNNHAEIRACIEALDTIQQNGGDRATIHTDSEFTIKCMTQWMPNWKRNNWKTSKGEPVKNREELMELDRAVNSFKDVKWVHVDGHRGIRGNEAADRLARDGASRYRRN